MKLNDVLYLVTGSQDVAKLEKMARELPVEIKHPWINEPYVRDSFLDVVLQADICEDYDMIVNLDLHGVRGFISGPLARFYRRGSEETRAWEKSAISTRLDRKLLEKIIKPARNDVKIDREASDLMVVYQDSGKEYVVQIKFWDGCP